MNSRELGGCSTVSWPHWWQKFPDTAAPQFAQPLAAWWSMASEFTASPGKRHTNRHVNHLIAKKHHYVVFNCATGFRTPR
jgi:hypothetical protein